MTKPITPTTPTDGAKVEAPAIPITPPASTPEAGKPVAPETKPEVQKEEPSLLDAATAEEKQAQEAENKRLLETPDDKLSDDDKVKKAEVVKAKEAADKAVKDNVVPEKYEFKVPEGLTVDPEYSEKASVIMKKHGITQAAATELGELAATQIQKINKANAEASEASFKSFVEDLKKETMKELGPNAKQELAFAAKTRDRLASPGLIEKLNRSGLANDIDVIKHFINIGKQISEGKFIEGKSSGVDTKDPLATLYPTTTKQG